MQMENRKLPSKADRNKSLWVAGVHVASSAGRRSQCSMARAPMPKRSQASKKTGQTASSGLDRAT
jgi:hypothetical protein